MPDIGSPTAAPHDPPGRRRPLPRGGWHGCRYPRRLANGKILPCRSARCPSPGCRRARAEKLFRILDRSFRTRPPTHHVVLKLTDDLHTGAAELSGYLRRFTGLVRLARRESGVAIEYVYFVEFDKSGQPHLHLLAIAPPGWSTQKLGRAIKAWWTAACTGRKTLAHCDVVKNLEAITRYVTKHLRDRRGVYPPPDDWDGRRCHLTGQSRGFFVKPKAELWRDKVAEWYGDHRPVAADPPPPAVTAPTCPPARPDRRGGPRATDPRS